MKDVRIAIVSADYRKEMTDVMESVCIETLITSGVQKENIKLVHVPGALEIPLIVQKLAQTNTYDALITFGVILKGDTYHFDQVANESVRGCMDVSWKYKVPVIYEVLTVYDMKHAKERVELRGKEGAETALNMIKTIRSLV